MSASPACQSKACCAVEVEGLTKDLGRVAVLRGVNLRVPCNSFVSIIGPNGAGKTTLLRILATLSRPSGGRVRVRGLDLQRSGQVIRQRIGFLSHQTYLYGELSPLENLRFYGRMYGVRDLEQRAAELLERFGLAGRRDDPSRTLSRGMQQRLSLARALLHRPDILLLDEPYASLDLRAADALANTLRELHTTGCTVLLTTHDLERGVYMADQVSLLVAGKIVYEAGGRTLSQEQLRAIYLGYTQGHT
jgi:heme exporter protein A